MFIMVHQRERLFAGGQEDWDGAARAASGCGEFCPDVEEEMVADEPVSCYNCRLRRWTAGSFTCTAEVAR